MLLCCVILILFCFVVFFFFSSRSRHTRCALVTGVQTCALPIFNRSALRRSMACSLANWNEGAVGIVADKEGALDERQQVLLHIVEMMRQVRAKEGDRKSVV